MVTAVLVVAAGAVGALLRDEVVGLVHRWLERSGLRAIAIVNLSAALLAGAAAGAALSGPARLVLVGGLLGGYSTYSTWMVESVMVGRRRGLVNVVGQAAAGVVLAGLGWVLGVALRS
ncbi:MAG: CrcB family protein [Actinobacteria bacterium]|nr:CrcB family protein [Actinomycetota bacterium]